MKLRLLCALTMTAASVQAMEGTNANSNNVAAPRGDSRLHIYAKNHEFAACHSLLTGFDWLTAADIQKASFPAEAIATMQSKSNTKAQSFQDQPAEFIAATKKMSLFAVLTNKLLEHQAARAQILRTSPNDALQTPYDCAVEAKAPQELIDLLDPMKDIRAVLMPILMRIVNAEGKIGFGFARPNPRDPRGPVFQPGQQVTIDGKKATCTEAKKFVE